MILHNSQAMSTTPTPRAQRLIDPSVLDRIQGEVDSNHVVLFMNGTPVFPLCGPSAQAVQILGLLGVRYKSIDVTTDPSLRLAIRDFSDWPTLPQLYVLGHFIGGNDVMRQMLETGRLQELFAMCAIPMADY
ncbi:MAG: monothiol glutaredoxin, Grx4 family [Alphaproteobacteria bacterium]|nr:monothiol glutaredoxin, Grx4 family [Alphaproteobacteria bacterium]